MSPSTTRTKSPRGRLHLRLAAREVAEIQQATKSAGATSPAAYFLNLVRQQRDVDALAIQIERQLQSVVEVAISAAIGQLGDRLATDLAALSSNIANLATALEERPTKAQLSSFLEHVRGKSTTSGVPSNGATVAP
ncbi:hypothetical protein [Rhodanobacter aciditrophus]|uniref:hypothetical protein n=1 Tax=Rhodanobacter aciditrophus TaxID=1623218 RepID=UPI003CEE73A4